MAICACLIVTTPIGRVQNLFFTTHALKVKIFTGQKGFEFTVVLLIGIIG